jgi:hypothetical protein
MINAKLSFHTEIEKELGSLSPPLLPLLLNEPCVKYVLLSIH